MCIWLLQITMQHMIVSYKRTPPRSWMWWPNLNNRKSLLGALFHKQISPGIDRRKQIITSNNVWQVNSNGRRFPPPNVRSIYWPRREWAKDYCVKCHLQFYLQSRFCAIEMVMSVELGISVDLGQVHSQDKYFQGLLAKCWILGLCDFPISKSTINRVAH